MSDLHEYGSTSTLFGGNAPFIEEQYERYLANPASVAPDWRALFRLAARRRGRRRARAGDRVVHPAREEPQGRRRDGRRDDDAQAGAGAADDRPLPHAGHVPRRPRPAAAAGEAAISPTSTSRPTASPTPTWTPSSTSARSRRAPSGCASPTSSRRCKDTYCGTLRRRVHVHQRHRGQALRPDSASSRSARGRRYPAEQQRHILERLTAAETLERYLHTRYVGQKRFSGEGGETMIPMLDHLIQIAGAAGVQETVIGMAHRGRLNVLVNTLGKMPADLFSEFEGKHAEELLAGDVKYHQGFSSDVMTPGGPMHLTLAFNPSHLEAVNPGRRGLGARAPAPPRRRDGRPGAARADPRRRGGRRAGRHPGSRSTWRRRAAIYTGGTIHIVVNNQIGFTTSDPRDTRGTLYCTDIAKMAEAPIFHVNADDPEVCLLAVEMALAYRQQFHRDVFIDLVCFRRLGHNEADEPMVTQPLMYKRIAPAPGHAPALRRPAGRRRRDQGGGRRRDDRDVPRRDGQGPAHEHDDPRRTTRRRSPIDWTPYRNRKWTEPADTAVPLRDAAGARRRRSPTSRTASSCTRASRA